MCERKYEMQAHSSEHTIQVHVHDFFHFLLRFLTANMQKKSWTVYLNENIVRNVYCINHLLNSFTFWLHTILLESICFWIETIFFILEKMFDDRWKTLLFQKEFVDFFLLKKYWWKSVIPKKNSIEVVNFSQVCLSKTFTTQCHSNKNHISSLIIMAKNQWLLDALKFMPNITWNYVSLSA